MSRFIDPRHQTLTPYVPGEQPKTRSYIKLNTNESPYPPSPEVIKAINRDEIARLRLYSDPTAEALTTAIAERYGLRKDQVFTTNGSDEALAFAFMAFCGDKGVQFPSISYGFYAVYADLYKLDADVVPLRDDLSIDIAPYQYPGRNVVLANPNAPTGLTLPIEDIEAILKAHPDDVVLIDEAYVDFGAESCVRLIEFYDNLLVVQTFSKSRSLAGARIGFAMGHESLISDLNRIKFSFHPYNLGRLPLLAGTAAMRDQAYFEECTRKIVETRAMVRSKLLDMGCEVTDSKANFLFVRMPGFSGRDIQQRLRDKDILVRRFDQVGIEDWLRVSIGTDDDMRLFLCAMQSIREEI